MDTLPRQGCPGRGQRVFKVCLRSWQYRYNYYFRLNPLNYIQDFPWSHRCRLLARLSHWFGVRTSGRV